VYPNLPAKLSSFRIELGSRSYRRFYPFIICATTIVLVAQFSGLGAVTQLEVLSLVGLFTTGYAAYRKIAFAPAPRDDQNNMFRRIFEEAAGMALVTPSGDWLTVNRSLCKSLGYSEQELLAKSFSTIVHPEDLAATLAQIDKLTAGQLTSYQAEQRFAHKLGHLVWMLVNISVLNHIGGDSLQLVIQFHDITQRKMQEERLVHDVFHDALTGLPNRALFMDRLNLALERTRRRKDQAFAVLFVDLDSFKAINDKLGHIMGDQLLIQVSRRLKACLRTTDTVARLGGDEFTILLEDLSHDCEALRIVERLQKELERPCKLGSRDLVVTASIGITSSKLPYERAEEMLRDADVAMYRAKSAGKACYQIFERQRFGPQLEAGNLARDLDSAVERQELVVHYQPIVSLDTGRLCACEALVRWNHPQRGLISPSDFIPLAEETGAIIDIGNWVLGEACLQLKHWQERFPLQPSLAVAVNLSSKQFMQAELIDRVIEILQATRLDPQCLKLEITESAVMENVGTSTILLQQLRALGIELAIDDFGTGYSSLSYLHRLPVNALKIDKSFVKGMVEKRDHAEIVKTILTLARSLGIRVVAEGVETLEQLAELSRLHCDAGQGFLFSKPVGAEAAEQMLRFNNQWQTIIGSLRSPATTREPAFEVLTQGLNPAADRRAMLRAV
jgi:diguanylate cyclase (GGDEF)-like protein/PAS domain S-box-containing protein